MVTARPTKGIDLGDDGKTTPVMRNDNHISPHGKSFSKKSFDQLAAEKGIKTFKNK